MVKKHRPKLSIFVLLISVTLPFGGQATAEKIGCDLYPDSCVDFPFGPDSFADRVFSYVPGDNVSEAYMDELSAIGIPDVLRDVPNGVANNTVALGESQVVDLPVPRTKEGCTLVDLRIACHSRHCTESCHRSSP